MSTIRTGDILLERFDVIACAHCSQPIDTAEAVPFTQILCPSCGTEMRVPARFANFILLDQLGKGGMGAVYKAYDETLGRTVAIKVMQQSIGQDRVFVEQFLQEARALAAILAEIFPSRAAIGRVRARGETRTAPRRSPRHPAAAHYAGPLAVLVSDYSASAAEILAAVVQHERRGTIVGASTPGNVLVCVRWPLPGGGELQLSVYDYIGPDGRRLEGRGVTPDLAVPPAPGAIPDPQLEAALATVRHLPATSPPSAASPLGTK